MNLTYKEIIQNSPKGNEESMWAGIKRVDELLDKINKHNPEVVREFLLKEYVESFGEHYNEALAKEEVANMMHIANNGDIVKGELINANESEAYVPAEDREILRWDTYVGLNSFLHDLAKTNLTREQILDCAVNFWLKDDDYQKGNKVWWYFSNK